MNKNYYEILEVDKNASTEIIEKSFKILAKKYHPDLQPPEKKSEYTEKFKLINEAYQVLSNMEKKDLYDQTLSRNNPTYTNTIPESLENNVKRNIESTPKPISYYIKNIIAFIVSILIILLILQIPFIKNIFSNNIFVNSFFSIFK